MKKVLMITASYWYEDSKGGLHKDREYTHLADTYPSLEVYENFDKLDKQKYSVNWIAVDVTNRRIFQLSGYDGRRGMYNEVL